MLRLARAALTSLVTLIAIGARADEAKEARTAGAEAIPRALREPERLTAGGSSELMGVLSPDQKALYFVSDASGTSDVVVQQPVQRAPRPVSGGLGDAIGPQPSRDGRHISYISFENDATGDVCVRPIDAHRTGAERCFAQPASAELQAMWWDDATLAVLSRRGLHGDFALVRMPIDGGSAKTVLARNMVGLALSPDRRWLAYIPLDRANEDVGVTFAQRTGRGIALQRLDQGSAKAATYTPRLPGVTGSIAFSERGDQLYFVQFLNDTNRDGTIDGDDHAVVFRMPFRGAADSPLAPDDEPEQLTSARWDCHYPAPSATQLIASCSHEGSLDVYGLPLEGAVPRAWDDARLLSEIAAARDPWTQLLLHARRLPLIRDPAAKEAITMRMMVLHLLLGGYESAIYDAEHRLTSPEARSWGGLVAELARHRSADLALIRGETSEQYVQSERERAAALGNGASASEPPRIAQLRSLVISEIEEDIGDKPQALASFRAVPPADLSDPLLAPLLAARAERLFRLRGDREALLQVYLTLSALPLLDVAERLEYARRFVEELGRGRSRTARVAAVAAAKQRVQEDSELALLLDVEAALLTLDDENQEEVRKTIFALYTKNKDPDRRRALVLDTLRAAAKLGNEYLQYQFVTSWASSLKRAHPERKYAEQLYNDIVLDRAYGEGRQGQLGESRGYFYGATVATDALEAHIGFIEARMAEGGPNPAAEIDRVYAQRFEKTKDDPIHRFVEAYRLARALPRETDAERHDEAVTRSIALLEQVAAVMPRQPQVHQVWGFVLHQRARRAGSREAAVDANRQYLLALDLARGDERLTATLLQRLGLLQASMGNHGLALRYLRQRDELPKVRPLAELALRIASARSAWHTDDLPLAQKQLARAEVLVSAQDPLRRYQPIVADRLGLALSTTDQAAARARYRTLEALLRADPSAAPINQLKAQLGLASSALREGDAKAALEALSAAERVLETHDTLTPEPKVVWRRSLTDDYRYTPLQYRALTAGLRAGAARALGDPRAALASVRVRVRLLEERLEESEADEDRLELAQAYLHLAELNYRLKAVPDAVAAVERGLALSDAYNESTGSELNDAELALLQAYAELRLYGGVRDEAFGRDLRAELARVYGLLCKYRNPRLSSQRFVLATYLTELSLIPGR